MQRDELARHLDSFLEIEGIRDFSPIGLQVEGKEEINHVATAVSASIATIEAAVDCGADALIVHHGMFWGNEDARLIGAKARKIRLLLENHLSLFGYHLPLDCHRQVGNNWKAAKDLGMTDLEDFGEIKGLSLGVKGHVVPTRAADFLKQLEAYYEHPVHHAPGGPEHINTVGIISGGAHWEINAAVREGLDCFITGSFDEPMWHIAKEEGIHFCAVGHSNSERVGPKALGEWISQSYQLQWTFIDTPNPF